MPQYEFPALMLGFCGDKRSFRVQSFHPIDGKAQQLGKLFSSY